MLLNRRTRTAPLMALSALFLATTLANAQTETRPHPATRGASEHSVRKTRELPGYEYTFADDALDAHPNITSSLTIAVRGRAPSAGLIRPRVQFVPEMLKSVEAL